MFLYIFYVKFLRYLIKNKHFTNKGLSEGLLNITWDKVTNENFVYLVTSKYRSYDIT